MSTQTPDHNPREKSEKLLKPWLDGAKKMPEKASAEFAHGADLIREKVLKSAEAFRDATFVDHICPPPKML